MSELIIDGSEGEGGGQILRSALALSLATGRPFVMERIRARRKKPGLLRQHLTSVLAAKEIGHATVDGAELGSSRLHFAPSTVTHGDRHFSIGTAGSTSLVLQTILPPLLNVPGRSRISIEGGTHNPLAPAWTFLERAFFPLLSRMGAQVGGRLVRPGFYPAGGGRVELEIEGGALRPLELLEQGAIEERRAEAWFANLPVTIAQRELETLGRGLELGPSERHIVEVEAAGPGNVLFLSLYTRTSTEVFSACGERGVSSEQVARRVEKEARRWLEAQVPVGEHLADQLLLPLALAGGGTFRTVAPSLHTLTNAKVIERFLPVKTHFITEAPDRCRVDLRPA
ncbi:MAG: RNA 3'-terminal phosphate cyclase [Deltaproteobacteria bacterium]|nr:RNA 3'-terminal phosphate cyclase [Deltaproteobacteria bacterium]